jgi:hypothetical protein
VVSVARYQCQELSSRRFQHEFDRVNLHRLTVVLHCHQYRVVGPGRWCLPRHMPQFYSINEGSNALVAFDHCLGGIVGPGRWCLPRHRPPFYSINGRSMTERAMCLTDVARHVIGHSFTQEMRIQNALDHVASNVPGRCCLSRHRTQFYGRNGGSKCF